MGSPVVPGLSFAAVDPFFGGDPEFPFTIPARYFFQGEGRGKGNRNGGLQPVAVPQAPEAVVLGARPDDRRIAFHGLQKADGLALRKALGRTVTGPSPSLEMLYPIAAGAEPHASIAGGQNHHHPRGDIGAGHLELGPIMAIEASGPILGGDPEIPVRIEGDVLDGVLGQAILVGVDA